MNLSDSEGSTSSSSSLLDPSSLTDTSSPTLSTLTPSDTFLVMTRAAASETGDSTVMSSSTCKLDGPASNCIDVLLALLEWESTELLHLYSTRSTLSNVSSLSVLPSDSSVATLCRASILNRARKGCRHMRQTLLLKRTSSAHV